MTSSRLWNAALVVALLGVGALGWALMLRPPLQVDVSRLRELPKAFGRWTSVDLPLEKAVEAELGADLNLQRLYRGPSGQPIWLYIGYYGTARGGRPEHVPRGCYPGAGWSIERTRVVEVDPSTDLRVNEYLVERDGETQLVHFWYRSHRRTGMLGGIDQNTDRLVGRLTNGRADGALVRVSTIVPPEGEVQARGVLMAFSSALDPLLGEYWPSETPSG